MSEEMTVSCQCGAFQARIRGATEKNGTHCICYCADCQAAARHLGQIGEVTDEKGGTRVYQTQPSRIDILEGQEQLVLFQLAKKGLYRWHTKCCNTPICNTLGTPKFSFAGFMASNITAPNGLGPVRARYKREDALTLVSEPSGSMIAFVARSLRFAAAERISGRWKNTPFFGEDGRSVVKPIVLSDAERDAAYGR